MGAHSSRSSDWVRGGGGGGNKIQIHAVAFGVLLVGVNSLRYHTRFAIRGVNKPLDRPKLNKLRCP